MTVKIDESRRHQLAGGIQHLERAIRGNVGLHRFNHAVANADIAHAAKPLARVQHIAAFDQQIELVVRSHRGANRGR